MALEDANFRKSLNEPATADDILKKYLAFQDVASTKEKQDYLDKAENSQEIKNHAAALFELVQEKGIARVVRHADALRKTAISDADEMGLPMTVWSHKSRTWAMRAIAKAYFDSKHREDFPAEEQYKLVNPLDRKNTAAEPNQAEKAKAVSNAIINERIGWEAIDAYDKDKRDWRKKINDEHLYASAKDLLLDETDPANPKLRDEDEIEHAELGETLRKAIPMIRVEKEQNGTPDISDIPPDEVADNLRLKDTGPMPGDPEPAPPTRTTTDTTPVTPVRTHPTFVEAAPLMAPQDAEAHVHAIQNQVTSNAHEAEHAGHEKAHAAHTVSHEKPKDSKPKEKLSFLTRLGLGAYGAAMTAGYPIYVTIVDVFKAIWEGFKNSFAAVKKVFSGGWFKAINDPGGTAKPKASGGGGHGGGHAEKPKKQDDHGHGGGGDHH